MSVGHRIEIAAGLMAVVIGIGLAARWLRLPYPILLVVGGLLLSLHDGIPRFDLPPDLVFLGFLPPLLYAAAFNTDWPLFRRQLRSITLLAVGLVLFTAALVAWAVHDALGLPWSVGFVLGAIVSPPDAVPAAAVTQHVRLPRVVQTLLEGESLVNDASALVALRIAVGVAVGGAFDLGEAAAQFALVNAGGLAVGLAGAWLVVRLHVALQRARLDDPKLTIAISLLTPYLLYLPAERLHFSGVLAVVSAGMYVGTRCERVFPKELFAEARAVWEMIEFLLNGLVFILIGLQLPVVLEALSGRHSPAELARSAAVVTAVVIAARLLWMFPGAYVPRWADRQLLGRGDPYPPWQSVLVVGWTGMRGVVSLAAALALPGETADGQPFPSRDLIQFLTFWVIFATLVGQGLTLSLLIRGLGVDRRVLDDADGDEAVAVAGPDDPADGDGSG